MGPGERETVPSGLGCSWFLRGPEPLPACSLGANPGPSRHRAPPRQACDLTPSSASRSEGRRAGRVSGRRTPFRVIPRDPRLPGARDRPRRFPLLRRGDTGGPGSGSEDVDPDDLTGILCFAFKPHFELRTSRRFLKIRSPPPRSDLTRVRQLPSRAPLSPEGTRRFCPSSRGRSGFRTKSSPAQRSLSKRKSRRRQRRRLAPGASRCSPGGRGRRGSRAPSPHVCV